MISRTSILVGLFILMIVLSIFVTNQVVFIVLSIVGLFVGISQFILDRKELKEALNYSRIDEPIWKQVLIFVLTMACVYFIPKTGLDEKLNLRISIYFLFIFAGNIFASYYQKFIHSIRSYNDGLKFPGRDSLLISWKDVNELSISKEKARMIINGEKTEMNIDRRDTKEFQSIIEFWESQGVEKVTESR